MIDRYDRMIDAAKDKRAVPRLLATTLYDAYGRRFGPSAGAIEKRIRRLLERRETAASNSDEIHKLMRGLFEQAELLKPKAAGPVRSVSRKSPRKFTDK